jgi:hypothetical protein
VLNNGWAILVLSLLAAGCGDTTVTQVTGPEQVRCQITLSSSAANVPAAASQLSVNVTAARDCGWSSASDASWVQVAPASGQGDGTVGLNVATNTQQAARATNVRVNDELFRVTQAAAAAPLPPCTYRLDPTSRNIGDNPATRTVRVETAAHCPWTATSSVGWITFESPTSGTGTATITYRVERNNGNDRFGIVTVAGLIHLVRQDGD